MVNTEGLKTADPLVIFRAVSSANGQVSRKVTIPLGWIKHTKYPSSVAVVVGNILILAKQEDAALIEEAAGVLVELGIMKPLDDDMMEEVPRDG